MEIICFTLLIAYVKAAAITNRLINITALDSHIALSRNYSITLHRVDQSKEINSLIIAVQRSISENNFADNLLTDNVSTPDATVCLKTFEFPPNKKSVDLALPCACFDRAGKFFIQVYSKAENSTLLTTKKVKVQWPRFILEWPSNGTIFGLGPVPLRIEGPQEFSTCNVSERWTTKFGVTFLSLRRANSNFEETFFTPLKNWWTLVTSTVPLSCRLFIRPGMYEVSLNVKYDQSIEVISKSNISINLSIDFDLSAIGHFVYPCPPEKGLPVSYRRPVRGCGDIKSYDVIRLYAAQPKKEKSTSIFIKPKFNYISEEKLPGGQSVGVAYFGCNDFDLIYPEYCFRLVTIFEDGMVLERATHCVQTQSTKYTPIHGEWSTWQPWTHCTISCGTGVQHRLRYCDKPKPTNGGKFCVGNGLDTKICNFTLCPEVHTTKISIDKSILIQNNRCACGCNLTRPKGVLVIDDSTCVNGSVWKIIAPSNHQIEILINRFRFRAAEIDRIKILDESPQNGPLLLFDSSAIDFDREMVENRKLRSQSDQIVIEYFSSGYEEKSITRNSNFQTDEWFGVLIKYSFKNRSAVNFFDRWTWWRKFKSDERWFLVFVLSATTIVVTCLLITYLLAAKYTVRKLRSKCHYLLILSQTSQTSAIEQPENQIRQLSQNSETNEPLIKTGRRGKPQNSKYAKNLAQIPEEIMQTSAHTDTTRLSAATNNSDSPASPRPLYTAKATPKSVRSIGIQLSSPALDGQRRHAACATNQKAPLSIAATIARTESPNFSFADTENDDFEYDYYDAPVPGSFFNYHRANQRTWCSSFFETDIDIDDIIEQSDLMRPTNGSSPSNGAASPGATMVSVSTQSHPVAKAGGSAESSEWSFKWTKPNVATTQFHFL